MIVDCVVVGRQLVCVFAFLDKAGALRFVSCFAMTSSCSL